MARKGYTTKDIDIMVEKGKRHFCTLKYEYCSLFRFDIPAMVEFIYEKRPSLKHRDFLILFDKEEILVNEDIKINREI